MGFFDGIGRRGGLLDKVLGLYGSDPRTHIPEARGAAARSGLQQGAAAILQSQLAGQNPSPMQQLQMGLMGLQQGGPQVAEERRRVALEDMLNSGVASNAQLQMMSQQALALGDYNTAQIIGQMLRARELGVGSKARGLITQTPDEDGVLQNILLDPTDGSVLKWLGPVQPDKGVVVSTVDEQGNPVDKLVNPRTGEEIQTYDQPPKAPSLQEEKWATDAVLADNAVNDVEAALAKLNRGPTFWEYEMYKNNLTRAMVPDDVQSLLQAQESLVSIIAKVVTGSVRAGASQPIREAINRSFLVAPGDSPRNREQTLRNLNLLVDRMKVQAGRAWILRESGVTAKMIRDADPEAPILQDDMFLFGDPEDY